MSTQPKTLAVVTTVIPKPTQAEILDALAQLEVQRRDDQCKADVEARKKMKSELESELFTEFLKNITGHRGVVQLGSWWSGADKPSGVEVTFDLHPSREMAKKLKAFHALPERFRAADFRTVRQQMLEASRGMTKDMRVSRLLKDTASRKSLEAILDTMTGK